MIKWYWFAKLTDWIRFSSSSDLVLAIAWQLSRYSWGLCVSGAYLVFYVSPERSRRLPIPKIIPSCLNLIHASAWQSFSYTAVAQLRALCPSNGDFFFSKCRSCTLFDLHIVVTCPMFNWRYQITINCRIIKIPHYYYPCLRMVARSAIWSYFLVQFAKDKSVGRRMVRHLLWHAPGPRPDMFSSYQLCHPSSCHVCLSIRWHCQFDLDHASH